MNISYDYKNIRLLGNQRIVESRKDCDVSANLGNLTFAAPVMLANVKSVADINTCQILDSNNFAYSYPRIDGVDDVKNFVRFANENFKVVSISIGIKPEWQEFIDWLVDSGYKCHIITIDSAYAFFKPVAELVKYVKKKLPNTFLIVGNGHTPEFIQWLENSGADAAKINVGVSCFTAGTRVLMSNGTYKNIEDIKVNDSVIAGTGKATKVTGVKLSGYKNVMSYYHPRFYKRTFCTHEHLHFVNDFSYLASATVLSGNRAVKGYNMPWTYRWKSAGSLTKLDSLLLPKNIEFSDIINSFEFKLDDFCDHNKTVLYNKEIIYPSYNLGFLIGAFLGDGTAQTVISERTLKNGVVSRNTTHNLNYTFNYHELDLAEKVNSAMKDVFHVSAKIECPNSNQHKRNTHIVRINCAPISKFFQQFYNEKSEKYIPEKYFVNNKDYLEGILDGIYLSDGNDKYGGRNIVNTSEVLLEQIAISCYLAKGFFPSISQPHKKYTTILKDGREIIPRKNAYNLYYSKHYYTKYFNDDYFTFTALDITNNALDGRAVPVYDIEVECESSSFIANNVIVHNSVCKTANFTGFSNSTVSQLEKCAAAAKNILIFADGGLSIDETDDSVNLGDISKAVRFGADFVFTSAPFARCSDSIVQKNGFYSGNSTAEMKGYSDNIEGTLIKVKDSGLTLEQMTVRIVESLQSSVSYAGGNTLEALRYVDYEVVL
jgi:hypothetical protein